MKDTFVQSEEGSPNIKVHENSVGEIFIGNTSITLHPMDLVCITFTPDESILFAKYVLKKAKQLKQ